MKKKVLALVLMLVVLASVLTMPAAAAGGKTFPDAKGHWAEESIMRWSRCGLVNGDDLGNVNPDKPLRRCEMATILSNMLGLRTAAPVSTFRDIDGTEWYARAILRCAAAGIMQGSSDSMSLPEDYITREEAITMFCRALNVPRDDDPDLSKFSDGDKVSGWAAPYMTTLTELGILSGMGDGTVAPHSYINRAGAFTLMDKAISVYANAPGNYPSQNPNGFIVINANTYQPGDVIVSGKAVGVLVSVSTTDTVRLRDFSSENVDINGKGSVIIAGKSSLANVEAHTEIELTVEANATIDALDINSEKITLTNAGTVKNLNCDKVATVTNSGKVENLVADAAVSITNTGTVDKLVANAGIKVDNNKGTIKTAEINKGGVVIDGAPQQMTVATGVARPNNSSGRPVSATGGVVSSGGGGSSSGGSSSGGSRPSSTVAVTGVTLSPSSWVMNAGTTKTLTATVEPSNASNKNVTWKSSDTEVATVANGVVTAVAEGEATITVTTASGSKTATCEVTVRGADANDPIPVKSVSFDKDKLELTQEETATLTLIIDPENATIDGAAKWESSDTDVVRVEQSGKLTALKPGTATITATVTVTTTVPDESGETPGGEQGGTGDDTEEPTPPDETENPGDNTEVDTQAETTHTETYTAECEVTVKAKPVTPSVTSVTVTPGTASIEVGKTQQLNVTVAVVGGAAETVTWSSSDTNIATVDENSGLVTAVKAGNATITATSTVDGTKTGTCAVTVTEEQGGEEEDPSVTSVTVTPGTASIEVGGTQKLEVTVAVEGGAAQTVTWTSSDTNIATVDENSGLVTAVKAGEATITATSTVDTTKKGTCAVTVTEEQGGEEEDPSVTSVTVTPGTASIEVDGTQELEVTVAVEGGAAQTVTWTSSDESVATVDENGLVTAVKAGEATITATSTVDTTKKGTCAVTVTAPPEVTVTEVTIDPKGDFELKITDGADGEKVLTAIVKLSNGDTDTTKTVTWSVTDSDDNPFDDDGAVVSVTPTETTGAETVTVKALKAGTAKVVVTVTDGEKTLTCSVTVTVSPADSSGEETDPPEGDDDNNPTEPGGPANPGTEEGEGEGDDSTGGTDNE